MKINRISFLWLLVLVAALPAAAQVGYCWEECGAYPPRSYCSQACLNCPGTCIEYPGVGCPDCAYWTTCGESGYLCLQASPVAPLLLEAPVPAEPDASAAPGLARQSPATLPLSFALQGRCAREGGS
jgi:hypothetical protein